MIIWHCNKKHERLQWPSMDAVATDFLLMQFMKAENMKEFRLKKQEAV